jgi:hypothetical protein
LHEYCDRNLDSLQGLIILNVLLKSQGSLTEDEKVTYRRMITELMDVYSVLEKQPLVVDHAIETKSVTTEKKRKALLKHDKENIGQPGHLQYENSPE